MCSGISLLIKFEFSCRDSMWNIFSYAYLPCIYLLGSSDICSFGKLGCSFIVYFKKNSFIYWLPWIFVAGQAFCSCGSWALEDRLSHCGVPAQLLVSMWDSPRSGIEPMSPALAGRLFTTEPLGKPPWLYTFKTSLYILDNYPLYQIFSPSLCLIFSFSWQNLLQSRKFKL